MAEPIDERRRAAAAPEWARRYPPLVALVVALFIALAVLPSALNVPQSNPTETLEYAPVPPDEDEDPPPPVGNFASLGLAGSASIEGGGASGGEGPGGPPPPDLELKNLAKTRSTKRCVGSPPRQTEDPTSPPCVAHFEGENFGSTYQGVTRDEIRVLFYAQGFTRNVTSCRDPNQVTPDHQYFDIAQPPVPGEHCVVRMVRTYQAYFNDRYQTYNRFVHFFVYFSGNGDTAEERRADAADNYNRLKPFAVISTAESQGETYVRAMAEKKVLNFGTQTGRPAALFQEYPKLIWSYEPSLEFKATQFVSYICTKIKGHKSSYVGNVNKPGTIANGTDRVYGLWYTRDQTHPELIAIGEKVRSMLNEQCGLTFATTRRYPTAGWVQDNRVTPDHATEAAAEFQNKKVTTVIWPGGLETNLTKQSVGQQYSPEFVVMGDRILETDNAAGYQAGAVWHNARIVTNITYRTRIQDEPCYVAYKEADPTADDSDIKNQACPVYNDMRQLFIGIQVAGPKLGPTSIDKGFHAIPKIPSSNPQIPACFYEPGDYTCVKDTLVERWDASANGGEGCYRVSEGGKRYLPGTWPPGDALNQDRPNDVCNYYDDSNYTNPNPPGSGGGD